MKTIVFLLLNIFKNHFQVGLGDDAAAKNVASQQEGQRLETWTLLCGVCTFSPSVGFLRELSCFLPQLKNHAGLVIGESKMIPCECACVHCCLSCVSVLAL